MARKCAFTMRRRGHDRGSKLHAENEFTVRGKRSVFDRLLGRLKYASWDDGEYV